uniref:Uncharacterized protein n=1 Tax=Arundo donax TaxID=35708 RepID=A0A0A9HCP2_ARUDO
MDKIWHTSNVRTLMIVTSLNRWYSNGKVVRFF